MKKLHLFLFGVVLGCIAILARSSATEPAPAVANVHFNPLDYGAKGDGATDDTAAIQAAIEAARLDKRGAKVFFPPGKTFLCAGSLNLDRSYSMCLEGTASPAGTGLRAANATIVYSGSGDNFLSAKSTQGLVLRGLRILYTNPAFTGTLIDMSSMGQGTSDTGYALVENCELRGETVAACNAAHLIALHRAIITTIRNCQFSYADVAIVGKIGPGYSNAINILGCTFLRMKTAGIKNAAEMWLIQGCTFEPLINGQAGAYTEDVPSLGPVVFDSCWFGDVYKDGTPWIAYKGLALTVQNSYVSMSAPNTYAFLIGGAKPVEGVRLIGNLLGGRVIATTGVAYQWGYYIAGNTILAGTTLLSDPTGRVISKTLIGNSSGANVLDSYGGIEFSEQGVPPAPATNKVKLFARDSAGKTQLCVRFATGDIKVLATQP